MFSDRIAQVLKARLYAAEPYRFNMIAPDIVTMDGSHHTHTISRNGRGWECSCEYFKTTEAVYHSCAHSIALERLLDSLSPVGLNGGKATPPDRGSLESSC